MKKRVHLVIAGRVQGVCYRMYAKEEAERLDLTGWIRNLPDGTVEATAEGEEEKLREFAEWCKRGPSYARVSRVKADFAKATSEFDSFDIIY